MDTNRRMDVFDFYLLSFSSPENDKILKSLSSFLDFHTLQKCRLVSSYWNLHLTRVLLSRSYLLVPPYVHPSMTSYALPDSILKALGYPIATSEEKEEQIRKRKEAPLIISKFLGYLSKSSIPVSGISISSLGDVDFLKNQGLTFDPSMTQLKFQLEEAQVTPAVGTINLFALLNLLPNLKTLMTDCIDLSCTLLFWKQNGGKNKMKFLTNLQKLDSIWMNGLFTPRMMRDYIQNGEKLGRALKELHLGPLELTEVLQLFPDAKKSTPFCFPNLENLFLNMYPDEDIQLVRNLFELTGGKLKRLYLNFLGFTGKEKILSLSKNQNIIDSWYIPPKSLGQLKELVIYEEDEYLDEKFVVKGKSPALRSLVSAVRVKGLKKLWIKGHYSGRFESVLKYLKREEENEEKFQNESLEEFNIEKLYSDDWPTFEDVSCFERDLWPNVKYFTMDVALDEKELNILTNVFSTMKKIEVLKLRLFPSENEKGKSKLDWDSFLTGMKRGAGGFEGQFLGLKELKNLRSLDIDCKKHGDLLSEFLIYNCLMSLENILNLQIKGCKFEKKSVEDLKAKLGPYVCVLMETN